MRLDAVGVVSKNIKKSVEFYSLLGFEFPEIPDDAMHIEARRQEGSSRFMIDSHEMIKDHSGIDAKPSNFSAFAVLCDSVADVDATVAKVKEAGFAVAREPWDAIWGQRYAVVIDPDGYGVDLFAPLEK
jgi:catechol 2,3-dioxygenase-like lactoylglutathione lyase family enzyme